jgi:hypothetical protein
MRAESVGERQFSWWRVERTRVHAQKRTKRAPARTHAHNTHAHNTRAHNTRTTRAHLPLALAAVLVVHVRHATVAVDAVVVGAAQLVVVVLARLDT